MSRDASSPLLDDLFGRAVVVDLSSPFTCLGTLSRVDAVYMELVDADLHDFRDSTATREVYIYDSARLGIRRNRSRVLIRREEIVAITPLSAVQES